MSAPEQPPEHADDDDAAHDRRPPAAAAPRADRVDRDEQADVAEERVADLGRRAPTMKATDATSATISGCRRRAASGRVIAGDPEHRAPPAGVALAPAGDAVEHDASRRCRQRARGRAPGRCGRPRRPGAGGPTRRPRRRAVRRSRSCLNASEWRARPRIRRATEIRASAAASDRYAPAHDRLDVARRPSAAAPPPPPRHPPISAARRTCACASARSTGSSSSCSRSSRSRA